LIDIPSKSKFFVLGFLRMILSPTVILRGRESWEGGGRDLLCLSFLPFQPPFISKLPIYPPSYKSRSKKEGTIILNESILLKSQTAIYVSIQGNVTHTEGSNANIFISLRFDSIRL
jgi:hypothetical protein